MAEDKPGLHVDTDWKKQAQEEKRVKDELRAALSVIPNMTHPDAPVSTDPNGNKVIKSWGEPRKFDFAMKATGGTLESLEGSMRKLSQGLEEGGADGAKAREAFKTRS